MKSLNKDVHLWYLLPEMKLGGAEKHVLRLAAELRRRGHRPGIATLFKEGHLAEAVRSEGIPFVCLNANPRWGISTSLSIRRWIKSTRVDILHAYLFGFDAYAGLPARLCGTPVFISSRRELAQWQKMRHRVIADLGNLFADRVVCCSDAVLNRTREKEKISPEKLLTLYNGVDASYLRQGADGDKVRSEFGIPRNAPVIGTVANFGAEKGYEYLAECAKRVLSEIPNAYFLWVGFGPLEKTIRDKVKTFVCSERIIFTGMRKDIPELIASMDLFVLASLFEGFPNVLLEAMAMEKPVIATTTGGIPELVEHEKSGLLVPVKNAEALAEAIKSLLQDRSRALKMGQAARNRVASLFTFEQMVQNYEKLYASLWQTKTGGSYTPALLKSNDSLPLPDAVTLGV